MRVNINWLKEYINLNDISVSELAERMLLLGNEYNEITKLSGATNVVIGLVESCTPHPHSERLKCCVVNLGKGETKQIICGAPNVKAGQKVIVAKTGAVLSEQCLIKATTIRGLPSEGMICSLAELGIPVKFLTAEAQEGIHVLAEEAPLGVDALEYLHFTDPIITFDLTANRGDLLSMIGMAYEVGAILKRNVVLPQFKLEETAALTKDYLQVQVETAAVPVYLTRLVKNVVIKESPNFIKARLMGAGIRPINNVVDISNYVMLEYGQPLHFFDYDKLGNKIIVRNAKAEETITTLDHKVRTLNKEDLVIASPTEPVCIGGILGGLKTEVTAITTNIVIESAVFGAPFIQKTANRIWTSEASIRFAKGVDPARSHLALDRAAYLLQKYAQGEVLKGVVGKTDIETKPLVINLSLTKIKRILGLKLSSDDVELALTKLAFSYEYKNDTFSVTIPTRRLDVKIEADLIEEVGRVHGYNQIKGILPPVGLKVGGYEEQYNVLQALRIRLKGLGLTEVCTYSLISKETLNKGPQTKDEVLKVKDPMSKEHEYLRYSLLSSLINVINYNKARQQKDIMIYEIGSSYYKKDNKYYEEPKLGIALLGNYYPQNWQGESRPFDFYYLKGILEHIIPYFGLETNITLKESNAIKEMHPYQQASIYLGTTLIGQLGRIHPAVQEIPIYLLELSIEPLLKQKTKLLKLKPVSPYPVIIKDLAWVFNREIKADLILKTIKGGGGELLKEVTIFDVYLGPNVGEGQKSIAVNLTFGSPTKTLTETEITTVINKIKTEVATKLKGELRDF